ncbi:hypothetical protein FYJ27_09860 [Anaerosalibacter bizertensis]|uniref:Uncharacterized protein n=1 Tax=Anaerosalibacter bizertensis TaxID=932217 RepID=A0A844FJD7_9FIRM|nr:hypothetical protein [Anaerosalibacter bizertensis]MBU5292961.1 hypothetical protein [Anaerosalibacter bizertensis]MCG4564179.1 hypothetical protein [Anaerosalibacter bizertensis]MSS44028.1 hypothetical protein [Anaerosalibacter bizertensis]
MTDKLYIFSIGILLIGFVFIGLGKMSYRFRAFTNKQAWNGKTFPFLVTGVIFSIVGIILVYIFYPYK